MLYRWLLRQVADPGGVPSRQRWALSLLIGLDRCGFTACSLLGNRPCPIPEPVSRPKGRTPVHLFGLPEAGARGDRVGAGTYLRGVPGV